MLSRMNARNNPKIELKLIFIRKLDPMQTSTSALDMQVTLENYYNNLISQHRERRDRLKRLEESLNENGLSETVC